MRQPKGYTEMLEALERSGYDHKEVYTIINHSPMGWFAEVRVSETGDEVFITRNYDTLDELNADLTALDVEITQFLD